MDKVKGLDSIRFFLAFIVMLGHGAAPEFSDTLVKQIHKLGWINSILHNSFVGVAAVMGFFIISGFCIHYPYSKGREMNIMEFYSKRIIRISLPAIIALGIYRFMNVEMIVVWSLICEIIYYFLYPIILRFKSRLVPMIITSFLISYSISFYRNYNSSSYDGNIHESGAYFTWLVGLPIWLLGVLLAENIKKKQEKIFTFAQISCLRGTVWFGSFICCLLRFHFEISYVWTLPIMSILFFFWIKKEIWYFSDKSENKLFAAAGVMSYSLYLIHGLVIEEVRRFFSVKIISDNLLLCVLTVCIALILSWIFYKLIEYPSHRLAKQIKIKH